MHRAENEEGAGRNTGAAKETTANGPMVHGSGPEVKPADRAERSYLRLLRSISVLAQEVRESRSLRTRGAERRWRYG